MIATKFATRRTHWLIRFAERHRHNATMNLLTALQHPPTLLPLNKMQPTHTTWFSQSIQSTAWSIQLCRSPTAPNRHDAWNEQSRNNIISTLIARGGREPKATPNPLLFMDSGCGQNAWTPIYAVILRSPLAASYIDPIQSNRDRPRQLRNTVGSEPITNCNYKIIIWKNNGGSKIVSLI